MSLKGTLRKNLARKIPSALERTKSVRGPCKVFKRFYKFPPTVTVAGQGSTQRTCSQLSTFLFFIIWQ